MRHGFYRLVAALACWISAASAETLALPQNLVGLTSEPGEHYLLESNVQAYVPLSSNFVTQKTQAFCGVASIVMVLNALEMPAPSTPDYEPYHTFTQDNLLDARTEAILPRAVLDHQGMTLDQLGALLALNPLEVSVHHAGDGTVEQFRAIASDALAHPGHLVVINYLRASLGQERGGHISPLAAYDAKADKFLIMDVARYKYPPVWVSAADLYAAMNTPDHDNGGKTRGFVLVARKAADVTKN